MTHTEALRLALDALEDARHHMSASGAFTEIQIAAQDACRAALAAPSVPSEPVAIRALHQIHDLAGADAAEYRQIALAALAQIEREAPQPAPAGWREAVQKLVTGFEHVSGIARQWEPDHSSGADRAKWARATEACADVVKLLAAAPAAPGGAE